MLNRKKTKKMTQSHQSDAYNFTQLSRSGQSGFESLKGSDARYYFHFNDASGKALLFSQAYIREKDAENGIQSVIRNAVDEKRFIKQTNTEGGHFFILRAGNKQEIAQSRVFSSLAELEKAQAYLVKHLTPPAQKKRVPQTASSERPLVAENLVPASIGTHTLLETENTDLKNKIAELETRVSSLLSAVTGGDTDIAPARQVFRIELYQSTKGGRLLGKIHHVLSGEVLPFSGLDSQAIQHFIESKLASNDIQIPAAPMPATPNLVKPIVAAPVKREVQVAKPENTEGVSIVAVPIKKEVPVATAAKTDTYAPPTQTWDKHVLREATLLTVKNTSNPKEGIRAHQAFDVSFCPTAEEQAQVSIGDTYQAQLYVYSFDTYKRFLLLERAITSTNEPCIVINIPSNSLPIGSYRLTLLTHIYKDKDLATRLHRWQGTALVQVF